MKGIQQPAEFKKKERKKRAIKHTAVQMGWQIGTKSSRNTVSKYIHVSNKY